MIRNRCTRFVLAIASSALLPSLANAAAAAPDEAEQLASQATSEETKLAPVVVTAQRRSEDVQDVPASISVVDGEALGIYGSATDDVLLLATRVPSVQAESSFGRTFPRFYVRGLGNTDFDLNASQPVSFVYGVGNIPFPAESGDGIPDHLQLTQELRLESQIEGPLDWQIGTLIYDERLNIDNVSYDTLSASVRNGFAQQRQDNRAYGAV